MKEFACGDVVPGCSARVTGETDDEVMQQVAVHARDEHGMNEVPDELAAQVRSLIRSA